MDQERESATQAASQAHGAAEGAPWSAIQARNIVQVLVDAAQRAPDLPALRFEDGVTLTRRELSDAVARFAGWLRPRITPGDRVAIVLENRVEFMVAWFAVAACRGMLVSLNPAAGEHDALHMLRDCAARIVISEAGFEPLLRRLRPQCPALEDVVVVGAEEPHGLAAHAGEPLDLAEASRAVRTADVVNVYYTSGTTGLPKGCMVDHTYWLRFVDVFQRRYGMAANDRLLCCLQFFYNDPPWLLLLSLHADTTLVAMRKFSVSRFWPVVADNDVTILFGISSTANLLLRGAPNEAERRHRVRLAVQVGIPASLHRDLVDRWGVPWVECYGLTESGILTCMPVEHAAEMIGSGSIGTPCPEVEAQIVDPDGRPVPTGQPGQLLVRAPGLMRGYLNRPEATAETLRDGWLHTGDAASMDERGFIYFRGRMKDIVRRSGANIAAAEVEQVLRGHPKVLEAAIIAVPDDLRGEEAKAFVLPVDGESAETLPPAELADFCAARLAPYKVPRYFSYRTSDFDRTPSMRVKKEALRQEPATGPGVWDREARESPEPRGANL